MKTYYEPTKSINDLDPHYLDLFGEVIDLEGNIARAMEKQNSLLLRLADYARQEDPSQDNAAFVEMLHNYIRSNAARQRTWSAHGSR